MTETVQEENPEKKLKISKKSRFLWIFLLLLAVGMACAIWYFRDPAVGTIRVVEDVSVKQEKAELPPERFEGQYISFLYPAEYAIRETQPDIVSLEKGLFVASGGSSRTIALAVQDMQGKTLADIPSYQLRFVVKKDAYKQSERKGELFKAIIFTKSEEGYEKTAFIVHDHLLFTISVSAQVFASPEAIDTDFEKVFLSLELK